jgi:hypothetical protein
MARGNTVVDMVIGTDRLGWYDTKLNGIERSTCERWT